jgi:hypothetical protein
MQRVARGDDIGPAVHPLVLVVAVAVAVAGAIGYGVAVLIAGCA